MQTHDIRKRFLDHFIKAGHTEVPSASLLLDDPPNLLFVNAGMVPFKPYFLGEQTPPYSRATSVQKCVRTLDIDEVGITTRHNTFFQMAGNFAFGDYFKREAINFAWTLLTNSVEDGGYGIDPQKLWPTVYLDDDEAEAIWRDEIGVPAERIQRRGLKDNYWSMGVPGPCGPCSEIFYDRGPRIRRRRRPGGRRGPLHRDLESRVHAERPWSGWWQGQLRDPRAPCPRRTSTPAWASSASPASCRASTTSMRPTCSSRSSIWPPNSPAAPTAPARMPTMCASA